MSDHKSRSIRWCTLMLFAVLVSSGRVAGQKQELPSVPSEMLARAFFGSLTPSKGEVTSVYDPTAVMVNLDKDELRSSIEQMSSSIFFLRFAFKERVDLDMDAFVVPNGDHMKCEVEWGDLFDSAGESIFRQPTDEEKEEDQKFRRETWSRIYFKGADKPVMAVGQMQVEIPVRIACLTLGADDVGKQKSADGLTATLSRCENDVASVSVQGDFKTNKPVVIFYDKTGGRLKTSETMTMSSATSHRLTSRASGKIARVGVFQPLEYLKGAFEVKATSKPEFYGEDAWNIRAPRYVADNGTCEFVEVDAETLKTGTRVVGRRGYAWYGFNEPRIVVYLPRCDNSCLVQVEMAELELFDSQGKKVEHKIDGGWFDCEDFYKRFDIAQADPNNKQAVEYSRSVGKLKIHYPASVAMVTLTVDEPRDSGLEAEFEGPKITLSGMNKLKGGFSLPDRLSIVRAYDAQGRRLKNLDFSGFQRDRDGTRRDQVGFWGTPVKVDIIAVNKWIDLELPFDMPAADKLPDSQQGIKPADY